MSKPEHAPTPGPWQINANEEPTWVDDPTVSAGGFSAFAPHLKDARGTILGRVTAYHGSESSHLNNIAEGRANARLIAAAPDLLEAAEEMMQAFHECHITAEHQNKLGRAIAKARGQG